MIAFCCALHVPVPRRAEKRLDITPGGLRIRFVITVQTDRATDKVGGAAGLAAQNRAVVWN